MNKTLYLRDEDGPIWDRAREVAEDKLSPVIVEALKGYIAQKEAEARDYDRIVIMFRDAADNNIPKAKGFYGRWAVSPDDGMIATLGGNSMMDLYGNRERSFAVAVTAKGNVVIYWWMDKTGEKTYQYLNVYPSFTEAMADKKIAEAARIGLERIGIPVEELDI